MRRETGFHQFIWNRGEQSLMFPVKMKSVYKSWKGTDNLICPDCEVKLNQKYICPSCSKFFTIGQIEKRKNTDTDVVYLKDKKLVEKQPSWRITYNNAWIEVIYELAYKDMVGE